MSAMAASIPESSLPAAEIRNWIRDGFREYGPDPWLFLRELAQNSRDAGARQIQIRAYRDDQGRECVEFQDDGGGMSQRTARDYLFRFYASSKEKAPGAAGRFGIGFWSVWRFSPSSLFIASRRGRHAWAVGVNENFQVRELDKPDLRKGTRIVLQRFAAFKDEVTFQNKVFRAAYRYCRHLMRMRPAHHILPVTVNGKRISYPLIPPGPYGRPFRSRRVSGGTALGEEPEVRVFSGGLPVWRGTSLVELTGDQERRAAPELSAHGLYPVVWMECPHLKINLSRRHPVHDPILEYLRRRGEREVARLFDRILNRDGGRRLPGRIRDTVESAAFHLRGRTWIQVAILLMLLIPGEIMLLRHWLKPHAPQVLESLANKEMHYTQTTMETGGNGAAPDLAYSPGTNRYFRLFAAAHFDLQRGFVYRPGTFGPAPVTGRAKSAIRVRLKAIGAAATLLPHPTGFHIQPSSLVWNRNPVASVLQYDAGTYRINLPAGESGELNYTCIPFGQERLSPNQRRRLGSPPLIRKWPQEIVDLTRRARSLSVPQRVEATRNFVAENLKATPSEAAARRFDRLSKGDWIHRVLEIRQGDCDVINGFAVLLLRRLGIPARLGIGWVGYNGRLAPRLHAWIEFYHQKWHTLDLSIPPEAVLPESSARIRPAMRLPAWILIAIMLLIVMLLTALFKRRRRRDSKRDEVLSRLVLGVLLYPGRWGKHGRLWTSAVLPCLNGSRISLSRALARIRRRGLYSASAANPLVSRHSRVLDSGNLHFQQIFRLIYGIVDLDDIQSAGIRAFSPEETAADPLLNFLAGMGRKMGRWGWRTAVTADREALPPRWIDLSGMSTRLPKFWRRPLLVISPGHADYTRACRFNLNRIYLTAVEVVGNAQAEAPVLTPRSLEIYTRLAKRILEVQS